MFVRRWGARRIAIVVIACIVLYTFFHKRYHNYEIDAVITDTKPESVWEYVSDFGKMRLLNPTILKFTILSDTGHVHDWRYTVEYTEKLSHWPYWLNTAKAHFSVIKPKPGQTPALYTIKSIHETCFFIGMYCLHSISVFEFVAQGENTYCLEKIQYQCPPFLGNACHRELEYQRKAIMHNLTSIFAQKRRTH